MMLDTYVMHRLSVWAEWRIRRDSGALGYPGHSPFVKVPGGGYWTPEMDTACYEMDQCVCSLRQDLRQAVLLEYTRTATQAQKAVECGVSLRTYQYRLEAAYRELLGLMLDQAAGIDLPCSVKVFADGDKKIAKIA